MTMVDSTYAAAPFDHAKADIILRSSDKSDFRVFKLFLSLASPFFETLFELPQPTQASEDQEIKDGLAVIYMPENSKTLDILLRFCYPCTLAEDPKLEVLKDVIDVLEKKVLQALSNPQILVAHPLRCFAIARRGRARKETLLAAKYTLMQPLIPLWFQEIDLITAGDLLALLSYHQKCGDAAYALRYNLSRIKSHYGSRQACAWLSGKSSTSSGDCKCLKILSGYQVFELKSPQWWEDFMEGIFVALRDWPCSATVERFTAATVQQVKALNCPACSVNVAQGMREFSELLSKKVEVVVSKVSRAVLHGDESLY